MANGGKVSAVLSAEAISAIDGAIATLREQMPFLVSATPGERRTLVRLGPRSAKFVTRAIEAAKEHAELVSETVAGEFEKDARLVEALDRIGSTLSQLVAAIEVTRDVAGAEAMTAALETYGVLRLAVRRDAGLRPLVAELGERFRRVRREQAGAAENQAA